MVLFFLIVTKNLLNSLYTWMVTITTTIIIIITHCPPPITHSPLLLIITTTEPVVVVMAAAKTTTMGPGAFCPHALQYIFCFFNCYENITETVPQTWMAIATTTITSCLLPVACHPLLTNTKTSSGGSVHCNHLKQQQSQQWQQQHH